jgi:hypothetical protein
VAFEVLVEAEQQWQAFRDLPAVRAALDAVPDPVSGLLIYRGRGRGRCPHATLAQARAQRQRCFLPRTPSRAAPGPDLTGTSPPNLAEAVMAGSPAA